MSICERGQRSKEERQLEGIGDGPDGSGFKFRHAAVIGRHRERLRSASLLRLGLSFRMDRRDIKARWKLAREGGTFLIPKHDPNELATPWRSYRTVLTHGLSASLDTFLEGDAYELEWYENSMGDYFVVVPQSGSSFSVTASGVASGSITASHDCDRLVVVSGNIKGWHCFGERAEEIQKQATSGTLTFKMKL